jgi:hypothetical protein
VLSKAAEASLLAQSLFERLAKAGWPVQLLQEQYRSHPAISAFPSKCAPFALVGLWSTDCMPAWFSKHLQPATAGCCLRYMCSLLLLHVPYGEVSFGRIRQGG